MIATRLTPILNVSDIQESFAAKAAPATPGSHSRRGS